MTAEEIPDDDLRTVEAVDERIDTLQKASGTGWGMLVVVVILFGAGVFHIVTAVASGAAESLWPSSVFDLIFTVLWILTGVLTIAGFIALVTGGRERQERRQRLRRLEARRRSLASDRDPGFPA